MTASTITQKLPGYAPELNTYHRAFEKELRQMVAALPIRPGDRVLDMGCGDGFYTGLLLERAGETGVVTGLDASPTYLDLARQRLTGVPHAQNIEWRQGDIARLPFTDGYFDFIWCAQSLFSLPDPLQAVRELRRVTREGGLVAVFENDTLHQLMLPWPPTVELRLRALEWLAFSKKTAHSDKYYVGRNLLGLFQKAGLSVVEKRSYSRDKWAPLDLSCRAYLDAYLSHLDDLVSPLMNQQDRALCQPYLDPKSPSYILKDPNFNVTFIDHVVIGIKNG